MKLLLRSCEVRSWQAGDVPSLVANANNQKIWANLRDRFPHPYTARDGQNFVRNARGRWQADLYALARRRLARAGVDDVHGAVVSTHADARRFYSYRRDGACGRMANLIWLA